MKAHAYVTFEYVASGPHGSQSTRRDTHKIKSNKVSYLAPHSLFPQKHFF